MGIIVKYFECFYVCFFMVIILCICEYIVIIYAYLCVYSNGVIIFNKMCKIAGIYFYCMLKARKKTNNLRYIVQLYAQLYILIITLRLENVYLFA